MITSVMQSQARQLLHNKFVVILGASVQRTMYKDLVLLLQRNQHLTLTQLKSKGELSFERDVLVEGGRLGPMTNGTEYREVRQYRSDHHLLRFYFLTRVYSLYVESILEDFRQGLKPDVIVISSCVWDISRYGLESLEQYKENLHKLFGQIKTIVCGDCLLVWALAMPLGKKIKGGFLVPEVSHLADTLRHDIIEANFYSSRLAEAYGLDVLDLHYHFRLNLQHRMPDSVHWDALAHRRVSSLLLQHAADAWGVDLHPPSHPGRMLQGYREDFGNNGTTPEQLRPRPLLDSVPLQRCDLDQQRFRSDRFQLFAPNSAINPPLHYPQHLHHNRLWAAAGVSRFQRYPSPGQGFSAPGNWRLPSQYFQPLPFDNLRPRQQIYLQVRPPCAQMDAMFWAGAGFRFPPHFKADDHFMRRRRRRSNSRTHPYPPHLPQVTPRHPRFGW